MLLVRETRTHKIHGKPAIFTSSHSNLHPFSQQQAGSCGGKYGPVPQCRLQVHFHAADLTIPCSAVAAIIPKLCHFLVVFMVFFGFFLMAHCQSGRLPGRHNVIHEKMDKCALSCAGQFVSDGALARQKEEIMRVGNNLHFIA